SQTSHRLAIRLSSLHKCCCRSKTVASIRSFEKGKFYSSIEIQLASYWPPHGTGVGYLLVSGHGSDLCCPVTTNPCGREAGSSGHNSAFKSVAATLLPCNFAAGIRSCGRQELLVPIDLGFWGMQKAGR